MNSTAPLLPAFVSCQSCGTEIAHGLLSCPGCHLLIHADRLKSLLEQATEAVRVGDQRAAQEAWSAMLRLLPAGSKQHIAVAAKLTSSTAAIHSIPSRSSSEPQSRVWKWIVGLGPIGLLVWKLKFIALSLLTNGKLLLLGLTNASTLLSMFFAFGVYWSAWGMWFALGFVLSIYIHEMGHVVALRRYGIAATAPMFVPGLGAFIRLRQTSLAPIQNARVGLAGPVWGLAAAVTAWGASVAGGGPLWLAIARTGAWINLFNLLPVWQLDGNRGFSALGRLPRGTVAAAFGLAWMITRDGLLALLAVVSAVRTFDRRASESTDSTAWLTFVGLIAALTLVLYLTASAVGAR